MDDYDRLGDDAHGWDLIFRLSRLHIRTYRKQK